MSTDPQAAKLVANERVKLLANNLDRSSSACVTVGVATPLAGWIYGVSGIDKLPWWYLFGGLTGWLLAASLLHYLARRALKGLLP
ncbi:hypothetical protein DA075_35540 (plasmid) [Methylobacterium currus]|uniref:Uncharacterized protein n=1 Tax=Methylobacterium currus TaxID=2051553 RepID=A0A2R4WXC9_9HYPH|nr:hypothetical protein [Methylobacterium currus]AWB26186.1 hypothetical protein DA075_35540 [Methylobacterium currus]